MRKSKLELRRIFMLIVMFGFVFNVSVCRIYAGISETIFLSESDPNNPLNIFRVPITNEIVSVASDILEGKELTDHQKIILFMEFMSDYEVGIPSDARPETVVKERIGSCGDFSNLLLALASTQGIKGRYINLMNYPPGFGHTVVELFINNKWQLYDPTYMSYYTDTPRELINPNVLSFEELRFGKGRDEKVVNVLGETKRLLNSEGFIGPDIYEKANPAGPIGPDYHYVYNLTLDLNHDPHLTKEEYGTAYQGAQYIGLASTNAIQKWNLTSLIPGYTYEFTVEPEFIGGEYLKEFKAELGFFMGGDIFDTELTTTSQDLSPLKVSFVARKPQVSFLLQHNYSGLKYNYLLVKGYKLTQLTKTDDSLQNDFTGYIVDPNYFSNEKMGNYITRGEAIEHVIQFIDTTAQLTSEFPYLDVKENNPNYLAILHAYNMGIISSNNGYFRPSDYITRQEMAVVINKLLHALNEKTQDVFAPYLQNTYMDAEEIPQWAQESVTIASLSELMPITSQFKFDGRKPLTRQEFKIILDEMHRSI